MARRGISKQEIFTTAKKLAAQGELPTAVKVRSLLATGSIATIQKYLKEWKTSCFNFNKDLINDLNATPTTHDLLESQRMLEQSLNQQIAKSENYAQELINAEKAMIALKESNHKLQTTTRELKLDLKEATAIKDTLAQINQEIQKKLEFNDNITINQQQQLIAALQTELKILNETSIAALRETSNNGHEALMKEKVTSINLQAKIDSLTKALLESNKQLNEAIMTSQVQIRSLSRQNEQLQKIIQENGLDQLPQQQKEGSSLESAKEVAAYGK